ncbi:hypothetical protein COO60DRAFT_1547223, partial [Scenedesmus sp. NREL 46B-D3]
MLRPSRLKATAPTAAPTGPAAASRPVEVATGRAALTATALAALSAMPSIHLERGWRRALRAAYLASLVTSSSYSVSQKYPSCSVLNSCTKHVISPSLISPSLMPWLAQSSLRLASVSAACPAADPLLITPVAINFCMQVLRAAELSRHWLSWSSSFMVTILTERPDLFDRV